MSQTWNEEKLVLLAKELKDAGKPRREVTLAICKTMFYELNTQPASSSVYKITRFGSMTDIQADIRFFWNQLREASQMTVNVAGVPEEVTALFSNQMLEMWDKAITLAASTFDQERDQLKIQSEHDKILLKELTDTLEQEHLELDQVKLAKDLIENEYREYKNSSESAFLIAQNELKLLREQLAEHKTVIEQKDAQIQRDNEIHTAQLQAELDRHAKDQEYLDGQWKASMLQVEEARQLSEQLRIERDSIKTESLERERFLNQRIALFEGRLMAVQKEAEMARRKEAVVRAERELLIKQMQSLQAEIKNKK